MTAVRRIGVLFAACGMALVGCTGDNNGDNGDNKDNGVAELSAEEILAEAQSAADSAESLRVEGTVTDTGSEIALDLQLASDSASGTLSADGTTFELLNVDGERYLRADAETWNAISGEPAAGQLLAGRFVVIPSDDPSFAFFDEFDSLASFAGTAFTPDGSVTKGDEAEINGHPVIGLISSEGGTLYVSTTGDALPVRLEAPEGETGGMDFEWNVSVEIEAPDEADVVDLSSIAS